MENADLAEVSIIEFSRLATEEMKHLRAGMFKVWMKERYGASSVNVLSKAERRDFYIFLTQQRSKRNAL